MWCGTETGGDVIVELNSQCRPSNQEKNQYWTVYWVGSNALYTKIKKGSDQEIPDLLEEGRLLAGIKVGEWEQRQPI